MAKILIVEDEQIISLEIWQTLEAAGYDIVGTADNGIDALALVAEDRPDLVLMDIMLRGQMDGIEAGAQVSAMDIPVVYLTAYSDPKTVSRAVASMPYGFLAKPYRHEELLASIEIALYRARIAQELRAKQEQLVTNQSQFLALLAHEIRNPISAINAAAESLRILDGAVTTPERQKRYERISAAIQNVDNLISISVDSDRATTTEETALGAVDILAVTGGVIQSFTTEQQGRIKLATGIEKTLVRGLPELLHYALMNLLDNAFKYSPEGSPIELAIKKVGANPHTISLLISDQGPGVPPAEQDKIFSKYYRATQSAGAPGLGLGLYIARHLVVSCGGTLEYRGKPKAGACFELALPTATA